jgi:hypothetical protein
VPVNVVNFKLNVNFFNIGGREMKKFICVLVFLAMVNVASAGMVDLWITSLDGVPITPTKDITIKPSQVVDLSLVFTGPGETLYSLSMDAVIQSDVESAEWQNVAGIVRYADYSDPVFNQIALHDDDMLGFSLAAGLANGAGDGVTVASNILLHCTNAGDLTITLALNPSLPASDSIVLPSMEAPQLGIGVFIHQIPEPMTLTLLGLGGLFLARKKR